MTRPEKGSASLVREALDAKPPAPTPRWTVAVYEKGMSEAVALETVPPPIEVGPEPLEQPLAQWLEPSPDAIADEEAAAILEGVAQRLRSGEILLAAETSPRTEAAVVAAVLTALLGERH